MVRHCPERLPGAENRLPLSQGAIRGRSFLFSVLEYDFGVRSAVVAGRQGEAQ